MLKTFTTHSSGVNNISFSPSGQTFVTASDDKTARLWDITTGREILQLRGHTKAVSDASISNDATLILTCSYDGSVIVWDYFTGVRLARFEANISLRCLAVSGSRDNLNAFVGDQIGQIHVLKGTL